MGQLIVLENTILSALYILGEGDGCGELGWSNCVEDFKCGFGCIDWVRNLNSVLQCHIIVVRSHRPVVLQNLIKCP